MVCKEPSPGGCYSAVPGARGFHQGDLSCRRFPSHLRNRAMLFPRVETLGFQSPGLEDGALPSMEASVEPLDAAKLGTWQRQAVEGICSFLLHPSIFLWQWDSPARRSHPGHSSHRELNLKGPFPIHGAPHTVRICRHTLCVQPVSWEFPEQGTRTLVQNPYLHGAGHAKHRRVARGPCGICIGTASLASSREQPRRLTDSSAQLCPAVLHRWEQRYWQRWLSTENPSVAKGIPTRGAPASDRLLHHKRAA